VDSVSRDVNEGDPGRVELEELGRYFNAMERWDDFEEAVAGQVPSSLVREITERLGGQPRKRTVYSEARFS
jgi:hypothetical protein